MQLGITGLEQRRKGFGAEAGVRKVHSVRAQHGLPTGRGNGGERQSEPRETQQRVALRKIWCRSLPHPLFPLSSFAVLVAKTLFRVPRRALNSDLPRLAWRRSPSGEREPARYVLRFAHLVALRIPSPPCRARRLGLLWITLHPLHDPHASGGHSPPQVDATGAPGILRRADGPESAPEFEAREEEDARRQHEVGEERAGQAIKLALEQTQPLTVRHGRVARVEEEHHARDQQRAANEGRRHGRARGLGRNAAGGLCESPSERSARAKSRRGAASEIGGAQGAQGAAAPRRGLVARLARGAAGVERPRCLRSLHPASPSPEAHASPARAQASEGSLGPLPLQVPRASSRLFSPYLPLPPHPPPPSRPASPPAGSVPCRCGRVVAQSLGGPPAPPRPARALARREQAADAAGDHRRLHDRCGAGFTLFRFWVRVHGAAPLTLARSRRNSAARRRPWGPRPAA